MKSEKSNLFEVCNRRIYIAVVGIIFGLLYVFYHFYLLNNGSYLANRMSYSTLIQEVQAGNVADISISSHVVRGMTRDGQAFSTEIQPNDTYLMNLLVQNKVNINVQRNDLSENFWQHLLINMAPAIILVVFWMYFLRNNIGKRNTDIQK